MKVCRVPEIVQVKVRMVQIKSRARISQNLTLLGERKDDRHAGILARKAFHARNVNAALEQTLHTKLAERIASNARSKTNAAAEERNIVGKNCRRAAESQRKVIGQVFSLWFKYRRKTVQNQITIQFTQNADVKTLHRVDSFHLQPFYVNALFNTRNIFSHNTTRECRQAIRSPASHCES